MTTFFNRTADEQELIRKALDFEVEALHAVSSERNPYFDAVKALKDGNEIIEAINVYVEEWG